ncbi:sulfite exporter TauE/SafE family protein [Xanthobacter flavus]|uniref:sulfite exporter TauE/SafE family protein n=1 Tax=Xanthobacter flavus TaxID=281 RepID=UPI001AE8049A|nr:sulfite exporter TauE/SafE family protein [Xanthobacter flavus]MBP2150957.1 putative membrane protein YfcA [Xanthobacter flavus]
MPDPHILTMVLVLSAVVAVAAVLRGFTGFGFGLFAMPFASFFMDPASAVPVMLLLQLASGAVTLRSDLAAVDRSSSAAISAAGLPFVAVGAVLLHLAPQNVVRLVVGIVTIGAALALAFAPPVRTPRPSLVLTLAAGASSGFLQGLVAMGGPPLTAFYLRGWFAPATARASMTLVFSLFCAAPLLFGALTGQVAGRAFALALALLPALVIGTLIGGMVFKRRPNGHRGVALIALVLVGAMAAIRATLLLICHW